MKNIYKVVCEENEKFLKKIDDYLKLKKKTFVQNSFIKKNYKKNTDLDVFLTNI